jgi:hypothetical protein
MIHSVMETTGHHEPRSVKFHLKFGWSSKFGNTNPPLKALLADQREASLDRFSVMLQSAEHLTVPFFRGKYARKST